MPLQPLFAFLCSALLACLSVFASAQPELSPQARLPRNHLDVLPPSQRVAGEPGAMQIVDRSCRAQVDVGLRQRIVDIAVQEWAYFGFSVVDETLPQTPAASTNRRPWLWTMSPQDASHVAASIAGYWSAAPDSGWILERQNNRWRGPQGIQARWSDAWSAAFISWVMCEGGLGEESSFKRAIAHHSYIDQAILASEGRQQGKFLAHDPGERPLVPGDLLCRGNRPAYRSLAQRKAQLGEGARTHCDIVVKLDEDAERILVIGGNVRGWVRLKILPAATNGQGWLAPLPYNGRVMFAHLALQHEPVASNAMDQSPTLSGMGCSREWSAWRHATLVRPCQVSAR